MKKWKKKAIFYGDRIRVVSVMHPIEYDYETNRTEYAKAVEGAKREDSARRAQDNFVMTVMANTGRYTKLMTLTYAKTCLDYEKAQRDFNYFAIKFKRKFGYKLRYSRVMERQKKRGIDENNSGSWHTHLIVYNSDKLDFEKLKSCWIHGSVDIKKVDNPVNIGRYLGKYLSKDNDDIALNKKLVQHSHGLKKPVVYNLDESEVGDVYESIVAQDHVEVYMSEPIVMQNDDGTLGNVFVYTEYKRKKGSDKQ